MTFNTTKEMADEIARLNERLVGACKLLEDIKLLGDLTCRCEHEKCADKKLSQIISKAEVFLKVK